MLSVEQVSYAYGVYPVLQNISLHVGAGEMLTLLGPNGSGKTTLMKCCSGTLRPSKGKVKVAGSDLAGLKPQQAARLVAILYQNHVPAFPYKVGDMVLMGRAPYVNGIISAPNKQDRLIVDQVMDDFGIMQYAERPYTELSGGERQLVLLARALAQEPKVLILDEPTAPLDFKNTLLVLKQVRSLAKEKGLAVLMCLHDPNHARVFSDKVALIKQGCLMKTGPAEDVIGEDSLSLLYNVEVDLVRRFMLSKTSKGGLPLRGEVIV